MGRTGRTGRMDWIGKMTGHVRLSADPAHPADPALPACPALFVTR